MITIPIIGAWLLLGVFTRRRLRREALRPILDPTCLLCRTPADLHQLAGSGWWHALAVLVLWPWVWGMLHLLARHSEYLQCPLATSK